MFMIDDDAALIVTDTLATTLDGEPHLLVSKCTALPHLHMVIAGTGVSQLIDRWRAVVASQMLARDIDMVDAHAPGALAGLWAELIEDFGSDPTGREPTATVYHFGLRESTGAITGYAYRSTNGFVSDPIPTPAFAVKPVPDWALGEAPDDIEGMVELAGQIRDQETAKTVGDRIHIGGELVLTVVHPTGISSQKLHRYGDFEQIWLKMNESLE